MHIGVDFDNTIVNYNEVFYKYAFKKGLVTPEIKKEKHHIREAIWKLPNGNDLWTMLQGSVYGVNILEAKPMYGVKKFFKACQEESISISIVSHKTKYPEKGPTIDLRKASLAWLAKKGFFSELGLHESRVFFTNSIEEKIAKIKEIHCTHFIDDLLFVLMHKSFPRDVAKILYTKAPDQAIRSDMQHFTKWPEISAYFFEK